MLFQDKTQTGTVKILLCIAIIINVVFWWSVRFKQTQWYNVPPAPDKEAAALYGLGDPVFSYRLNGLMLQNLGDTGGRITALKDYNYEALTQWFFLQDYLDPRSNFIPYLAGYYFSALQEPERYRPVLDYLKTVGVRDEGQKWRWLAQGVYIARFKMNDMDLALELASLLAAQSDSDTTMPAWTKQMPAFVLNAKGNREEAYALMLEILKSNADTMHPSEVNSMKHYICTQILSDAEAEQSPLCADISFLLEKQ